MGANRIAFLKTVDAILGPPLCILLGTLTYLRSRHRDPRATDPRSVERILVIRPGGMGDMIVLLPVLAALAKAFPRARTQIVCEKRNVEVLELAGCADSAMPYDVSPLAFLRRLRTGTFDVVIDTEQFHHFSAVFAALSGAETRIGFKMNPRRNPLYTHLVNYAPDGPEGEQFARLLAPLGVPTSDCRLEGYLAGAATALPPRVEDALRAWCPDGSFAVLHPGSSTVFKRWEPGKFVTVAEQLWRVHRLGVVLVGDAADRALADGIRRDSGPSAARVLSLAGDLDLRATAEVLRRSRLFLGTDSGLAHLAVALGRPTVVLFGPTDHMKWGTEGAAHAVVRRDLPCAPCFIFGYHKPCRAIACMSDIAVDEVMGACTRVLA